MLYPNPIPSNNQIYSIIFSYACCTLTLLLIIKEMIYIIFSFFVRMLYPNPIPSNNQIYFITFFFSYAC